MGNEIEIKKYEIAELQIMASAIAKSGLFGDINTPEKALTLMLICQAEGINAVQAVMRYNIISGKPSKKSKVIASDFIA